MGNSSSAPTPPPPPEVVYRNQIGGFVGNKQNQYRNQANTYNKSVSNFTNQFNDIYSQGNDTYNQVKSLGIADADSITNYRNDIDGALHNYNTLVNSYSQLDRPTFQTSYNGFNWNGQYIPAMASVQAPALSNGLSDYQVNTMNDGYEKALSWLDKLDADRTTEQNRILGFQTSFRNSLNSMNDNLSGYGIADIDQINSLSRSLDQQKQLLSDFNSPLSTDFSYSDNMIGDMETQIGSLRDSYNAESQRIADFQNTLNNSGQSWTDTIGGLTIADADQISGLNTDIEKMIGDAQGFRSDLATDFDLSQLYDANRSVDDLQAARDSELARIATTEANAMDTSGWLTNTAAGNKGYSLAQIENMQKQLDDQRSNLNGFSSLLDFDSSDELASLDSAQLSVDELSTRRQTALDSLFADQASLGSQLGSIYLSNESGIKELQNQIKLLQSQGNAYSGGRAPDLNTQLGDLYTSSADKLQELYDYRTNLESQAQDLLASSTDTDFLDLAQLKAVEDQFGDLNSLVSQYQASAATDEVSRLQQFRTFALTDS